MKRRLIVTDLTRFSNKQIVCTAGVDVQTGECIRPMPYLAAADCQKLNILPGAILIGDFTPVARTGPHQEDFNHSNLMFHGPCSAEEFREALESTCFASVSEGFEFDFRDPNQKMLPPNHPVQRSIVTIAVSPSKIEIVEDMYKPGKIKVIFTDGAGQTFRYIPVTDLGFHDYALQHQQAGALETLNSWLQSQEEVFLRIGLSREYTNPQGRTGFWLQVNGIYTFPDYHPEIRSYSK
jgi:hypothetical protein